MGVRKRRFWRTAATALAVPSAIVTILVGWGILFAPKEKLRATVLYGPHLSPPSAEEHAELLDRAADSAELLQRIESFHSSLPEEVSVEPLAVDLRWYLRNVATENPARHLSFGGYWHVEVTNRGDLPARDVALILPYASEAMLVRGAERSSLSIRSDAVNVGDMRPKEAVTVVAWTYNPPARLSTDDIVLSHSRGVGDIVVLHAIEPLRVRIVKYWPIPVFAIAFLLLPALLAKVLPPFVEIILSDSATEDGVQPHDSDQSSPTSEV